jgi:serine protease Do
MEFTNLSSVTRQKFAIGESVSAGVIVTSVDADSPAAEKNIQAGEVIEEINQIPVKDPADVANKIKDLKDAGKKSALLLIANARGEVRFVALAMQ